MDPRTKSHIRDALEVHLYTRPQAVLKERIDTIILRNCALGGFSHKSFVYKNAIYDCDIYKPPRLRNRLLTGLKPEMEQYLADVKQLNDGEKPLVLGFITRVLNSSNRISDYRKVFPDSVHDALKYYEDTSPNLGKYLSDDRIAELQTQNAEPIQLMKSRMMMNLLI